MQQVDFTESFLSTGAFPSKGSVEGVQLNLDLFLLLLKSLVSSVEAFLLCLQKLDLILTS